MGSSGLKAFLSDRSREIRKCFQDNPTPHLLQGLQNSGFVDDQESEMDTHVLRDVFDNLEPASPERLETLVSILYAAGQTGIADILKEYQGPFDTVAGNEEDCETPEIIQSRDSGLHGVPGATTTIQKGAKVDQSSKSIGSQSFSGPGRFNVGDKNDNRDQRQFKKSIQKSTKKNITGDEHAHYGPAKIQKIDGQAHVIGNRNKVSDKSDHKTMNYKSHNK